MSNKFFKTDKNITQLLKDMYINEAIILELTEGTCFAKAQRLTKSYTVRNNIEIINEGFRAINSKDQVIKFLKITKIK